VNQAIKPKRAVPRHYPLQAAIAVVTLASFAGCSANPDRLKIKASCDVSKARSANPYGSVLVAANITPVTPPPAATSPEKPAMIFDPPAPTSGDDLSSKAVPDLAPTDSPVQLQATPPGTAPTVPQASLATPALSTGSASSIVYEGC
jgi:hypothetical protein